MSVATTEIPYFSGTVTGALPSIRNGLTESARVVIPISCSDFEYRLEAQIVAAELVRDRFIATFAVDEDVDFILTIVSQQIEQGSTVESGRFSLNYSIAKPTPRAHFVASSLMAIFALAGGVQLKIPELDIDQRLNIVVPLLEISQLLQRRQMAYRLLVIGNATGVDLLLPPAISVADKNTAAFVYHAIVDRSFTWNTGRFGGSVPARREWLAQLPSVEQPSGFPQVIDPFREIVLGRSVELGRATVIIEDAVIKGLAAIREEIASDDGHEVKLEIESLSGQIRLDFPEAPCVRPELWDPKITGLIELDSQLDSALFAGYNDLAAATLEGLSEAQKAAVTRRPELGEDAFSI